MSRYNRLTPAVEERIRLLYRAGRTYPAIAAEVGVHRSTVSRVLSRLRVSRDRYGKPEAERARALELYRAGARVEDIAAALGWGSAQTVATLVRRAGEPRRRSPGGGRKPAPGKSPD